MQKKIMIIDNDHQTRDKIKKTLSKFGYIIEVILNFEEIYAALSRFKPDVFILDINLRGGDGRSLCNELKANFSHAHIPVILLTSMRFDQIGTIDCEADAILGKPINMDNLLLTINGLLST
ncbi:response regulator [Pedobacter sp. G11]|nr:response regulator [Pedobacter sp. G11]